MKRIIEKYICDACHKEMASTEQRYIITLGISNSWDEDAVIDEEIKKDLCCDCYRTISQLIGEKPACEEQVEGKKKARRSRGSYDKELIKELWARGFAYIDIAAKANVPKYTVSYIVSRMTDKEKGELKEKYCILNRDDRVSGPEMKFTTDASGMVISMH